jgi:pyrroline-5-carboxylate reductase
MTGVMERPLLLVGCGKMGAAMLEGWLDSGIVAAGVDVVEPAGLTGFATRGEVRAVVRAGELSHGLDPEVVVFAIKPQQMAEVVPHYRRFVKPGTVFLSIAAGTPIRFFEEHLGEDAAIIRAMPNTPAAIGQGITVICPNGKTTDAQTQLAQSLLQAVGEVMAVDDEALIDPVTAVSGSGPAYVFLLIEAMADAGVAAGLPRDLASRLALVTVAGAGQLAMQSNDSPATLRENVTSPGGTTAAALQVLMANDGLTDLMKEAIAAATRRGRELAG